MNVGDDIIDEISIYFIKNDSFESNVDMMARKTITLKFSFRYFEILV